MKSRDPSSDRNGNSHGRRSLRAHLRRVAKESLEVIEDELRERVRGFIANSRSVELSKQRLSAVLWNDRALAAHTSPRVNPPQPAAPTSQVTAPVGAPAAVERVEAVQAAESAQLPAGVFGARSLESAVEDADFEEVTEVAQRAPLAEEVVEEIAELAPDSDEVTFEEFEELEPEAAEALAAEIAELAPSVEGLFAEQVSAIAAPVESEPPAPAVATPGPPPAADDGEDDEWVEPIRTRSMARLLAGQGHRDRALAIYDALIAIDASDASLRDEADALRQANA